MLKTITRKVIGYCDIPEEILENTDRFDSYPCDCYVEYTVTPVSEREKYTSNDNWGLEDWILQNHPEIREYEKILIELNW